MKPSRVNQLLVVALFCFGLGSMNAQEKPLSINRYLQLNDDAEKYYDLIEQASFFAELNVADTSLGASVREYLHSKEFQIAYLTAMGDSLKKTPQYRVDNSPKELMEQLLVAKYPAAQPFLANPTREMLIAVEETQIRALVNDAPNNFSRVSLPVGDHPGEWVVPILDSPLGFLFVKQEGSGKSLVCSPRTSLAIGAKQAWFDELKPVLISTLAPSGGVPKEESIGSTGDRNYLRKIFFDLSNHTRVELQVVSQNGKVAAALGIYPPLPK